jgi:GT2 family glycosyltransferase
MSKIGIVVLNYNDFKKTREFILEIKKYRLLNEIVIVDNNSTDSSYENLKHMEKGNITILQSNENKGCSYGNNIGIRYLKDKVDYIIISNPDISLKENVIRKLKNDLDENPDISLISPVIKQNGEIIRGWRLPKVYDEIKLNLFNSKDIFNKNLRYEEKRYNSELTRVDVIDKSFFMIRSDIFNMIGNFDDSVFLYYEENILGTKLKNINRKSYIDNEIEVENNEISKIEKINNQIDKYKLLKDSQKYFVKYYLHANAFEMFLLRIIYRIKIIMAYIVKFFKKIFKKK